jgi:hypothetical protein
VWRILEYGAACWDPFREGQIISLDQLKKKFSNYANDLNWKMLGQLRKITCIYSAYKAYSGELGWQATVADYIRHTL